MSGVPYHAWTHAPKAEGGTDPMPDLGGATTVVNLFTWDYDNRNTVDSEAWTPVANFDGAGAAGPDGYFEETFYSPAETGMTWDYKTGTITMEDDAEYEIHAAVAFEEDPQIDNELRVVALTFIASTSWISTFRFDIADGGVAQLYLPVTAMRRVGFGSNSVQLQVWHNAGVDLSIRDAEMWCRKFEPLTEPPAVYEINDPFP